MAIGGGVGGSIFVSRAGSGHSKGKCLIPPGCFISSNALMISFNTDACPIVSPGFPNVRPNGYSIAAILGTFNAPVNSGILDTDRLTNPASSIAR